MPKQKSSLTHHLPVSEKLIERRIYSIRGKKVLLDDDLAELYEVETKNLNKAVKRNQDRFPVDFMFQLTKEEAANLRFQFGTSSYGGRRYLPYAFTDYGVAMLSAVLNSERAVQMSIVIMRAFINLRIMLEEYKILSKQVNKIKGVQDVHSKVLTKVLKRLKEISFPHKTTAIGFRIK